MRSRVLLALALSGTVVIAGSVTARAGGGGGGGPPPDPAIAYVDGGIRVMNADGSNSRLLVAVKGGDWVRGPCWSPDSSRIAFCGRLKGSEGIRVVNLDGTGLALVTSHAGGFASFPDWTQAPAPDGQHKLVFDEYDAATDDQDLWIVNPDGTGRQNLTQSPSVDEFSASWTRDGTGLYVERWNELVLLSVAAAAGGGLEITDETVLVSDVFMAAFPRSANAHDFVGFSMMSAIQDPLLAQVLDVSILPWTPVGLSPSGSGTERWVSFSPDDSRAAFHRSGARISGIFTINSDGSGETRINKSGIDPNWKRR